MRYAPSPPKGPAALLYVLLAAQVAAVAALAVFEHLRGKRLVAELTGLTGRAPEPVVGAVTVFAVLIMAAALITAATVACFLVWVWRARRSAELYGFAPQRLARGWAVAAWFLPVANLVLPVLVLDDLWRASAPGGDRRAWHTLLAAWWASWLALLAVALAGPLGLVRAAGPDLDLTGVGLMESAATAIAAATAAAVVRAITLRQRHTTTSREPYGTASAVRLAVPRPVHDAA
ncbi:DUF4328 domain-containing protein [Bailinhaonella thermotolerans]|uniref:DUF4328 domain-containing protein n=1 Tax=Bailinhaonella thermotolerans TaxID=1070861 RepID=A0A3A4A4S3_9ACTN|nr:DUF4328 domain-containing protein [Bailinhaonella thermotolerans]RJL22811.1 DUF4328 domain-containing protein [Bailinhaonella thermotolerans]